MSSIFAGNEQDFPETAQITEAVQDSVEELLPPIAAKGTVLLKINIYFPPLFFIRTNLLLFQLCIPVGSPPPDDKDCRPSQTEGEFKLDQTESGRHNIASNTGY